MGDRCDLEMTLRREDLARFAPHVDAAASEEWWDELEPVTGRPDLALVRVHEANYGWLDERVAAANAGIPFVGHHGAGGNYGPHAFVSWEGAQNEAPLDHDGDLIMAVGEDLVPIATAFDLHAYVKRLHAAREGLGLLRAAA